LRPLTFQEIISTFETFIKGNVGAAKIEVFGTRRSKPVGLADHKQDSPVPEAKVVRHKVVQRSQPAGRLSSKVQ
jgi:hypothetical protein